MSSLSPFDQSALASLGSMTSEQLRSHIQLLSIESFALKTTLAALTQENNQLKDRCQKLTNESTEHFLVIQEVTELKKANELLTKQLVAVREENELLKTQIAALQVNNNLLKQQVDELEKRDKPIAVREAMRILEKCICVEVAGSKTAMMRKGLYNFDKIEKDASLLEKLKDTLTRLGLTEEHLAFLGYLKDCGDLKAHAHRPSLTANEWMALVSEDLVNDMADEDAAACARLAVELLRALSQYVPQPPNPDEPWCITDPLVKCKTPAFSPTPTSTTSATATTTDDSST